MKKLATKPNITPIDSDYPYGDIKDKTNTEQGTDANREVISDHFQFFERMFALSGITANGLPDNLTNGFQLYEAFRKLTRPYNVYTAKITQVGTGAPTAVVLENTLGTNVTLTRVGVGVYQFNNTADAFTLNKCVVIIGNNIPLATGFTTSDNPTSGSTIRFRSRATPGGAAADDIFDDSFVEIRVYD